MPKEPAGVAPSFCPYGRIDKDKLGKLFALANQQYEPLFVRNARHRPQSMVFCCFDISNHREIASWKCPTATTSTICVVQSSLERTIVYHTISYVHIPFQTRLITPNCHHHSRNWTKTPCVGTIWLVSRVVYILLFGFGVTRTIGSNVHGYCHWLRKPNSDPETHILSMGEMPSRFGG